MPKEITYTDKQARADALYKSDTNEWLASLTPKQRSVAEEKGITGPSIASQGVGAPELDLSRVADVGNYEDDFNFDDPPQEPDLRELITRISRRATRALVVEILDAKNARLTVECLVLVTGIGYLGISETTIAKKYKITRAAVSKRCVELCEKLHLPPSRSMKSEAARKTYRASRIESHRAG